ncbi:MAG: hypothetical protein ACK5DD_16740 [Cyclobacteriaceae bacterium]
MHPVLQSLHQRLSSFRRKYYWNNFLRGSLLTLSLLLTYLLVAALLEYNLWMGSAARLAILLLFVATAVYCIYRFLRAPLAFWLAKRGLGDEDSARLIGRHFPEVRDRLVNVLQLSALSQSPLAEAGIAQKSRVLQNVPFENAVDLRENLKYLRYLLLPVGVIVVLSLVNSGIFTQSTQRIVQFNREFSPAMPFRFVMPDQARAFVNEDFTLIVRTEGEALPAEVYINNGALKLKMENTGSSTFQYVFEKVQGDLSFQLEASGFFSDPHTIPVISRPELLQLGITLEFPGYLRRNPEQLSNPGALEVPEGTRINWKVKTAHAQKAFIEFRSVPGPQGMQSSDNQFFIFNKGFRQPDEYSLVLENEHSKNRDRITYPIQVIKDQHPEIVVENLRDSVLYKAVILGGSLADDYGLTELQLHYQVIRGTQVMGQAVAPIELKGTQNTQSFFITWPVDSLQLQPGDQLNYYLEVWDNDGVNGRKSTRSASYVFAMPGQEELKAEISRSENAAENKLDRSLQQAKSLQKSIEEAQQKLRGKQTLSWEDKQMLQELVDQKQKLDEMIERLVEEKKSLNEKKEAFTEQSDRVKEKAEQLQKLIDELKQDDEMRKLFEELEKMLKENTSPNDIQKMLEKMNRQEMNLEKELERAMELLKQEMFDFKLDQAIQQIKQQTEEQKQLLEKTQEAAGEKKPEGAKSGDEKKEGDDSKGKEAGEKPKSGEEKSGQDQVKEKAEKPDSEKLAEEQQKLKSEFEKFEETLNELEKMGEEINEPTDTPGEQEREQLKQKQQESEQQLKENKPRKSMDSQKKAIEKMQQMQQQLEGMQNSMEMEMNMENLESMRQILHGLIKLSFDQETLMKDFNEVQQSDPRYIALSQQQLKLQDDAKVLEDSLLALAKRDVMMGAAITREVTELNGHIDKAVEQIKERRKANASAEMQSSMTSINNLALMLNDHFEMMMDMMANAKPGKGKKKQGQPSLGQMQMKLNQQMQELKKGGKGGRELSEELAKLAAEQQRIRQALQEMQEKLEQQGGKAPGGDLPGKMEQTEMDLVNKQITEQTIRRQEEILTRLLEAEKSMREQNLDEERKGETAKDYEKLLPRSFEEYLRLKEKEVELLKTIPPKFYPFYKKEVNEYFKRMGNPR